MTGDAVNVAARFEQAAAPGEVLIGETTQALVYGAVVAEPIEPLELKGKSEPMPAFRLVSVLDAVERSHLSRFVGRERELALIGEAWQRAQAQSRCELLTVVGDAGVGKSRLVAEALATIEARVVRGRCLPYGEGITYWPVVEVIKQLDVLPADPVAAAAIRSLLGESDVGTSGDEIAWAFRKLLEEQAPLVCVFDDVQWGEETFLDLIESTALLSTGAPLLLLCMARPELVERRPAWPATLRLEPLPPQQADAHDRRRRHSGAARADRPRGGRQPALHLGDARDGGRPCGGRGATDPQERCWRCASTSSTRPSAGCSSGAPSRARSSTAAPSRRSRPKKLRSRPASPHLCATSSSAPSAPNSSATTATASATC